AAAVKAQGVEICLNTRVTSIKPSPDGVQLVFADETRTFDQVLTTTSPRLLLSHASELTATAYGKQVGALDSIGAVCVVLALKRSLLTDGTYWLNLPAVSADKQKNPFPFLALV